MSPPPQTFGGSEPHAHEIQTQVPEEPTLQEVSDLGRMLDCEPAEVRSLVAVLTEPLATMDELNDETVSPLALRAVVTGLLERQRAEREAFLAALTAYRELTGRLSVDVAEAREQLALETERARIERHQLVAEFLDRVDVLSAKISTSAARYTAELAEKESLRAQEEQRVLAYAQQAAIAQSVIDDIYASNSWRLTRPVRLLSRLLKPRRPS
jgi:hypothetical protein